MGRIVTDICTAFRPSELEFEGFEIFVKSIFDRWEIQTGMIRTTCFGKSAGRIAFASNLLVIEGDDDEHLPYGMAHLLRAYNAALHRRPMLTQSITAAFLFGAGDIVAQQAIEGKGGNHDFLRTARLTFYGGALFGPAMTTWYSFLNRIKFATPTKAVIYRVWLDQALLTPIAVGLFYSSMSILEGKPEEAVERVQTAYVPTLLRNWGVFIPTQIINFSLTPPHLRFVVVSIVSLFWNTYLSASNASIEAAQAVEADLLAEKLTNID